MSIFWYIGAFGVALGTLIVIHELGHYLAARWVGVKVLRFSVGFGKPLLMRKFGRDQTEWVLAAFPLGGYVKMLDRREGQVDPSEVHRAFDVQPVLKRSLVVVAGPVANLLLAVLLYWAIFMAGSLELRPLLGVPPANTVAARAGVENGDTVRAVSGVVVATMQEFRWQLMKRIIGHEPVVLETINPHSEISFRTLDLGEFDTDALDSDFARILGFLPYQPILPPVIGVVAETSVAYEAGLMAGDSVSAIDGVPVDSWNDLAGIIRKSPGKPIILTIVRGGVIHNISVIPNSELEGTKTIGRIGVGVQEDPVLRDRLFVTVKLGPSDAMIRAVSHTWDTSVFSLRMIGRMLIGEQSWKNLSGPVTIADYAGQSARLGLEPFLKFLALISISLGVLNLLPIPILDGGHLMYYLIEVVKGSPLTERAMEVSQQVGMGMLMLLMAFAFFNDINRLISG